MPIAAKNYGVSLYAAVALAATIRAADACCSRNGGGGGGVDANAGSLSRPSGGDVERLQAEKVALNLLKTLRLDEPPKLPAAALSASNLADIRRMVTLDQAASAPSVSASAVHRRGALQHEEGATEADALLYVKGERASSPTDGATLLFTLSPQDRHFRVTGVRINAYIPPENLLHVRASASRATRPHDKQPHGLRVDVVHRSGGVDADDGGDGRVVKIERIPSTSVRFGLNWYRLHVPAAAVSAALATHGRAELRLTCGNCRNASFGSVAAARPAAEGRAPAEQQQHDSPVYMVLVGQQPQRKLAPRAGDCNGRCCLRELTVDFDQLGPKWYWVLKPRRFQANYCWGSCGSPSSVADPQPAANHSAANAVLTTMLRHLGVDDNPSCCVPSSSAPVEVLYFDGDGTVRMDRHGLSTVTGCSCS